MCGIAGCIAKGTSAAETAVRRMTATMQRRGPDSEGLHAWPGAALGHRRLAVLDLSPAGHQPMVSEDGQTGLVFNGCIYNFQELRGELEKAGHRFRSQCDTEVLLRGYLEWGIEKLLPRLHGMFAFAVWDNRNRKLTLVRDRLGVKPLVYCASDEGMAFASTITALRGAGFGGAIDPEAVLEYLEYGHVLDPRSIFSGIHKVPPATAVEWRNGQRRQWQYWAPPAIDEAPRIGFEDAVQETERLLLEAVRLRLVSDVPVGALLSGGIDSSLVCWALQQLNANIKAFTISAPGDASDESAAARETAQKLGIEHDVVQMPDTNFPLDEMIEAFSEPFSSTSAQAMLWVAKAVKPGATVLLTGDGGDDVFLGYPFFKVAWMAERMGRKLPGAARSIWRAARNTIPRRGAAGRLRNFIDYGTGGLGPYIRAHNGLPYFDEWGILGERLQGCPFALRQIEASADSSRHLLAEVFDYHRRAYLTSEFMTKVDGSTMHYSLEARSPFLDQRIWEFAAALTPCVRFHDGTLKAVLREIARRRLGPKVASRQKQGFTVPSERWLADRWSGMLDRLRGTTLLESQGWVRRGALERPLRQAIDRRWVPVQLWRLLVLEHWLAQKGRLPAKESEPTGSPVVAG